jgi:gliding motility-associated-like protein
MKYIFTLLCSVLFTISAFAQPVNDDCVDLIDLGTAPACIGDIYTNVDATDSNSGPLDNPTCFNGGTTQNDVFFGFMVDAALVDVTITVIGTDLGPNGVPITNPQFALYRGACGGLAELNCISANVGETTISLDVIGLTPGIPYFIRVNDYSGTGTPNWGDFTLCIEEYIPAINMGEDTQSSACSGTVYDSGGPDGDYGNNENFTFTICPNDFTQCVALDVESFNIIGGDALNIYEGSTTAAPLIASITGNSNGNEFEVQSSNSCMTLEFVSDGFNSSGGFVANWQCSPLECAGSEFDDPVTITEIPFNNPALTTCGEGANFNTTPCGAIPFLNGPETVFLYQSEGGICASINVTGAEPGTGVLVLNGLPDDPGTVCVAQSAAGSISSANFQTPGDYYIIVANPSGCTDFGLNIVEADCALSPALVDALCNPLNGCIVDGDITSEFMFEDGFQDIPNTQGVNNGCWGGVGIEPDYYWFTIEAQADGPFGFILSSANIPSDIDFNVWGPFSPEEVCETPQSVIDFVTNNQPIRSSYAGGTEPTGLADIHPQFGYDIEDEYDCQGNNDDIVMTIPAMAGEVFVVLANDWGNQIQGGGIQVDWGPSDPDVLQPLGATVAAADTSVCIGETVQLEVITGLDNIEWVGPNAGELSCTNCFNPVATPSETQVYMALLDAVCYVDTLEVTVNVFDLDAGPDIVVCIGEEFEIPAGQDFTTATYSWSPPPGLTFSCTECPTPIVTADAPGVYDVPVTLTAAACNFMDFVTITVLDFTAPEYTIADDERICDGELRQIGGDFVDGNIYVWTSVPASTVEQLANPVVQPDVTTTYFLSVTNGDCPTPSVDSITIEVTPLPIIDIAEEPMDAICLGDEISLSNTIVEDDVNYSWSGPNFIVSPDSNITVIIPAVSGDFVLTGERLGCESTDIIPVEVVDISIDLNEPDTTFICQGESVQVQAAVTPTDATVVWNPADVSGPAPLLSPDTYTVYTATVTIGNCVRSDTFAIQVDSLPGDMAIMADPMEDSYCQGELVTLSSPTYDPVMYPDITHEWIGIGLETSDTLFNMVLTTADTFTYQRITVNGGCVQVDTILLNVISNDALEITPAQPEVCAGESIQLTVMSTTLGELEWTPGETLSCDDCPNPLASPSSTTTYTVSSSIEGCAIEQGVTVIVPPAPVMNARGDITLCPGESIDLNPNGGGGQDGTTYQWTSATNPNVSTDVNPIVTPATTTTYTGTATNICGTATDEVTVTVVDPGVLVDVNGGIETLVTCRGFEFDLVANVDNSTNGTETLTWLYNGESQIGETTTWVASESGIAEFIYQYGISADEDCAEFRDTVMIVVNDAPQLVEVRPDTTICFGLDLPLTLFTGEVEPGVTYSWTSTAGDVFMEADPEVQPTATTTYRLEASLGECVATETVTITVVEEATFAIDTDLSTTLITENMNSVDLIAAVPNENNPDVVWSFSGVTIGNGSPLGWMPSSAQQDSLPGYVFASLNTGCQVLEDSILIQKLLFEMPNIFSPNGDGDNDVFKPFFLGEMEVVELTVYNRWGQVVFESNDPNNPGWEGKKDDKDAPSEVYIYTVRVGVGGEVEERTGQVTLLR